MVFVLIKREKPKMVCWFSAGVIYQEELKNVRYDSHGCSDIKLENGGGGYNYLVQSDVIVEIVEGKNWDVVETLENREKTSFYQQLKKNSTNKSLKIGWLSPSGVMHYCEYHDHISYVHVVLGSDVPTIEKQGWIHIIKGDNGGPPSYFTKHRITQDQARTLREELGCHVFEEQILYQ